MKTELETILYNFTQSLEIHDAGKGNYHVKEVGREQAVQAILDLIQAEKEAFAKKIKQRLQYIIDHPLHEKYRQKEVARITHAVIDVIEEDKKHH